MKLPARFALQANAPGFIQPAQKISRPRGSKKVTVKEKDLQAMAENLATALGIRWFRIPDKLLSFLAFAAPPWTRVFVARYFAGFPDIVLYKTSKNGMNICKMIEIKTEAGKLSQSQKKYHSNLNVTVTFGWLETETAILEFSKYEEQ